MGSRVTTCLGGSFKASNAVQHIVGPNVPWQGLNGVFSKSQGPSEVYKDHVEPQGNQKCVAGEEGAGVA